MRLKPGVDIQGIQPELVLGLAIADSVYIRMTGHDMTVTSVKDGEHMVGSLHDNGYAADLRTSDVDISIIPALVSSLESALGERSAQFDLIFELNHLHLEYDPDK